MRLYLEELERELSGECAADETAVGERVASSAMPMTDSP
jgi:hypothetical protein